MQNGHMCVYAWVYLHDISADSIMLGHSPVMSNAVYKTRFEVTMTQKPLVNHCQTTQHLNKLHAAVLNLNQIAARINNEPFCGSVRT